MALQCGIVGLPNVGKSSLFTALTDTAVAAENYPFCTIEPNVGVVPCADGRLDKIAAIAASASKVPASLRLVDIAGLVQGAAAGEGLGNQFLARIREVDGIIHMLRCFDDQDVAHVSGRVDPVADARTVELELALADLATVQKAAERLKNLARSGDKDAKTRLATMELVIAALDEGRPVRALRLDENQSEHLRELFLLTAKPVLYCANLGEADDPASSAAYAAVAKMADEEGMGALSVSARFEAELAALEADERAEMLAALGQSETGLQRLVKAAYALLGLETFFTAGPKEARAWEFARGMTASETAGLIHTDMQRGFICAETISYDDYVSCGGEAECKKAGKLRQEGRDYQVVDGDVMHFRFNV